MNFRIWDKALNRWVEEYQSGTHCFTETYISLSGEVVEFIAGFPEKNKEPSYNKNYDAFFRDGKFWTAAERYVVQRGTGMKDIHGKEIFEGDIIRVESGLIKIIYSEDIAGFECVGLPHLVGSRSLYGYKHAQKPDKVFKVVGNIFENPELIQNK